MQADDCSQTLKAAPSPPPTLSVEEWWAEKIKPSRQRNLTPSQRASLAAQLRRLRRALASSRETPME